MNALRWIGGFFGYFAVQAAIIIALIIVGYPIYIADTFIADLTGIDIVRVLAIALICFAVLLAIAIGVRSNLYHIKKFCKKMVDAFMRI